MSKPTKEIKERIKEALIARNMTQQELADSTKIPKASISQYISGYAKPKQDRISMMSTALRVDPVWLMGYDVPMQTNNSVPVYEAAAGEGRLNDGYPTEEASLHLEADQVVFKVTGRSMEPTLMDGDLVVVQAQNVPDCPQQICLVKINGEEATLKRVQVRDDGIVLAGDNASVYPPRLFTEEQVQDLPVLIQGVAVKFIRELD